MSQLSHRLRTVLAVALLALLGASAARAAGVGPVDSTGIPTWYQDAVGLQLAPCLLGPPSCFGTLANLNANGGEAFYWSATADLPGAGGANFKVVTTVEASNVNGGLITFGRVRVTGTGLLPNTTYTVNEPYGDLVVTSDAAGVAKDTQQAGCAGAPCTFGAALASPVFGGFLQWDSAFGAPPLGFIGDDLTPHQVIGSPLARNSVTVTGGGLSLFTNLFVVQGELAAGSTPPGLLPPAAPPAPHLLLTDDTGASQTDNVTKVAAPTITGTSVRGALVTVKADGAAVGTGTALPDGTFAIKLGKALANGVHTIVAVAANPVSGAASLDSLPLAVTVDTTVPAAPSTPTTSQPQSATVGAFFTGTAETDSLVSLLSDGNPIGSGPATGGAYSIKGSALGTGVHQISAIATDLAGNTSATSGSLTLVVGSLGAASSPALSASSDSGASSTDGITNVAQPTFVGSVSQPHATVTLFADGKSIGTGAAAGGAYSITAASKLADGAHLITVTVHDPATGLDSAPSAALGITIDTAAPSTPSVHLLATGAVGGTADADSVVTVFLDDVNVASGSAPGGTWSATLAALAAGSHRIEATATDVAGNTSARSAALIVAPASSKPTRRVAGGVSTARFDRRTATVSATMTVDEGVLLSVTASAPRGARLALLRGSRFGNTVQRSARASTLQTRHGAGRVRIALRLDRAQLAHAGLYRISVRVIGAGGRSTKLRLAFRVT